MITLRQVIDAKDVFQLSLSRALHAEPDLKHFPAMSSQGCNAVK